MKKEDKLYGITGKDGYTRISSRKQDLPEIKGRKIVEVKP